MHVLYNNIIIKTPIPKPTIVTNEVEQFEIEAVNILLEWTVQEDIHGFNVQCQCFPTSKPSV